MIKKLFTITILIFSCFLISAQSNQLSILSAAGNYSENSKNSMVFTIGEPFVETYTSGAYTMTQGFNQAFFVITSVENIENIVFEAKVYPNPAQDFFILERSNNRVLNFLLLDINGAIINQGILSSNKERFDLKGLSNSTYFLKLFSEDKINLKTYKIQKVK